jgi:hypothetical protein
MNFNAPILNAYRGRIFKVKLCGKYIPILIPILGGSALDPSICDFCTFNLHKIGLSGCRYYSYAHLTCSGKWSMMKFVVPVIKGSSKCKCNSLEGYKARTEGDGFNFEKLPDIPTDIYQVLLDDPRSFIETALINGYLNEKDIDNLPLQARVVYAIKQYLFCKTLRINNFEIKGYKNSYTAGIYYENKELLKIPKRILVDLTKNRISSIVKDCNYLKLYNFKDKEKQYFVYVKPNVTFFYINRNGLDYTFMWITKEGVIGPYQIYIYDQLIPYINNCLAEDFFTGNFVLVECTNAESELQKVLKAYLIPHDFSEDNLKKLLPYFNISEENYEIYTEDGSVFLDVKNECVMHHKYLGTCVLYPGKYFVFSPFSKGMTADFIGSLENLGDTHESV